MPCDVGISAHSVVSSQGLLLSQSQIREFKNAFTDKKGPLLSSRIENGKDIVRERSIHTTQGFACIGF